MRPEQQKRLDEIASIAVRLEVETGFPPELLIAQWAVESAWGERPVGRYNHFGIKRAARHTKSALVKTHEVENGVRKLVTAEFADYDSLYDACRDYVWLLTRGKPYRAAYERFLEDGNLNNLIDAIARVYATDPNYARLLKAIAGSQRVKAAIERARTGGKELVQA